MFVKNGKIKNKSLKCSAEIYIAIGIFEGKMKGEMEYSLRRNLEESLYQKHTYQLHWFNHYTLYTCMELPNITVLINLNNNRKIKQVKV